MYGYKIWKLTITTENKKNKERTMLWITKRSTWIREQTKVRDIIEFSKQKWKHAGYLSRMEINRQ